MTKITRFNVIAQHKLQDIIASSPKMPNSHIINRVRNLAKSFSIPKTGIPIFSPANTAHPTNIFDRNYEIHKHKGTLHNQHPVMPSKNLSVKEEVARKIFYLQNIMESIPQVMQNLGIDNYHEYNNLLDLHSWAGCDADGNINITHETMQDALKQSQDCVINFAENHIVNLINNDNPELKNIALSMQNVMQDLKSQKSSTGIIEQSHINLAQTQLLNLINTLDVSSNSDLKHLVFILNNIGLSGYKLDVRQSSKVIDVCANDMANIVAKYGQDVNDDIKNYAKKNENTNQIEQPSEKVISILINNKNHINTIIQHKDELSKVSQLELNRMLLIQEHTDVFKTYRISDARNDNDVYFMRFMEKLAQISTNKETSQNTDFVMLAETEDDIKNLFENTQKIINKGLFANNRIQIFVGYSDAQKRMGISGELVISEAVSNIKIWLDNYNNNRIQNGLKPIDIIINHGGGSDIMRGAKYHAHGTYQGIDANYLSSTENLQNVLATSIIDAGNSAIDRRAKQYQEVMSDKKLASKLDKFRQFGIRDYRKLFAYNPEQIKVHDLSPIEIQKPQGATTDDLVEKIIPTPLIQNSNTSSRAGSKGKTKKLHLDEARAIGLSAQISATGTGLQVFSGLPSIKNFSYKDIQNLKIIFDKMEVFQDIIYKGLFEALKFDPKRAKMMLDAQGIELNDDEKNILSENEKKINQFTQLALQIIPLDRIAGINNDQIKTVLSKLENIDNNYNTKGQQTHAVINNFMHAISQKLSIQVKDMNNQIKSKDDLEKHGLLNIIQHADLIQTGIQPHLDDALQLYALQKQKSI